MRIGMYYKWFKEGKLNCTQKEMSDLWSLYEDLKSYSIEDRKVMKAYSGFIDMIVNPTRYCEESEKEKFVEDMINIQIKHLNEYFELMRSGEKAMAYRYLL